MAYAATERVVEYARVLTSKAQRSGRVPRDAVMPDVDRIEHWVRAVLVLVVCAIRTNMAQDLRTRRRDRERARTSDKARVTIRRVDMNRTRESSQAVRMALGGLGSRVRNVPAMGRDAWPMPQHKGPVRVSSLAARVDTNTYHMLVLEVLRDVGSCIWVSPVVVQALDRMCMLVGIYVAMTPVQVFDARLDSCDDPLFALVFAQS